MKSLNLLGTSLFLLAMLPDAQATDVLTPTADSYVKNTTPTTNYGTTSPFIANNANGVRVSYLRFDLSAVARPITSAKLELTIALAASGQDFSIYALNSSAPVWTETSLNWNNAPGVVTTYLTATGTVADFMKPADLVSSGAALATFTSGASGTDVAFDVTSGPVLDALNAATGSITFLISEPGASDVSGVGWNSREAATGQPQLTLSSTPIVTPPAGPNLIRVVLIGGQSNADGRASNSGFPTVPINYQAVQDNVPFYYYTFGAAANTDGTLGTLTTLRLGASQFGGSGPEIGLGYDLSRTFETRPGTKLALIKYAKGGSSLFNDWKAGGDATTTGDGTHYLAFQQVVTAGLAKLQAAYPTATIKIAGMIWVQGETDIDNGTAPVAAYGANLTRLIADLRATYSPSMPFVLSRISANQTVYSAPTDPNYADYLTIRAQQANVAATVPAAYMIDTDGAAFAMNPDFLHFAPLGQIALGQAFAARLSQILNLTANISLLDTGYMRVNWSARPLASYQVKSSNDLTLPPAQWTTVFTGIASTWTDPISPSSGSRRFYVVGEN